jgi:hypothetical protein
VPSFLSWRYVASWPSVAGLFALGLLLCCVGIAPSFALGFESPTPMPYQWPAHHAVYLHTDHTAGCRIDDGVHEAFTVMIPESGVDLGGRRLGAQDTDATITCTDPVTVDLDPDLRYAFASAAPVVWVLVASGAVTLTLGYRFAMLRLVRGG